jgi:hypothetical protein
MPITSQVESRLTNQLDRARLARTVGISPGIGEMVLEEDRARHDATFFLKYAQWHKLGPTAIGPARPVESASEDLRIRAFDRVGYALLALAIILALLSQIGYGVLMALLGATVIAYHLFLRNKVLSGPPTPLPVYTVLPPGRARAHVLLESVDLLLQTAQREGRVLIEPKLVHAIGRLDLAVRQCDPKLDVRRQSVHARRFGGKGGDNISLGYIGFDQPPRVIWELANGADGPAPVIAVISPRVLQLKAPVAPAERARLFRPVDGPANLWRYEARFTINDAMAVCPSISVAAMIDPGSAGNTLRLTISRAVTCRHPQTLISLSGIEGTLEMAAVGAFRRPRVEISRGAQHGSEQGLGAPSMEDDPQRHAPEFGLSFIEEAPFLPGDSLTVYFVFGKPISPYARDAIAFAIRFAFLQPVCGIQQLALFDPLGYPAVDPETAGGGNPAARALFMPPSQRQSTMSVRGSLSLADLRLTLEETLRDNQQHSGRLPDASLVHELITMLVSDHHLAMRDVREDLAERSSAERGALVWTLLAKDSVNLLSPDIVLRVVGSRMPGTGQDATTIELSVIAKQSTQEDYDAATQLKNAIGQGIDQVVRSFASQQPEQPSEVPVDVGAEALTGSPLASGDLAVRLDTVVRRAEAIIERFERLFR